MNQYFDQIADSNLRLFMDINSESNLNTSSPLKPGKGEVGGGAAGPNSIAVQV